mgnify:FL=1
MKKLLLLTFILTAFTINAQDVTFGAKAGLNFASMTGDDADGFDGRTSFHLGVTAEIAVSDVFSIQPELLYSGQGFTGSDSYEDGALDINVETTGRVNYLNLPIMVKYYASDSFSLEFGPQIGFLLSAESETDVSATDIATGVSASESTTTDFKDDCKSTDFALNLGAGYKLDSGLNFGLRYSIGMTDVPDGDSDGFKHSVLQLSVGYNF